MTTEVAPTICPGCGAKIPRRGLSMCPYCITPLTGEKTQGDPSEVAARLARMEEKDGFTEAVARTPEEGVDWQRGANQRVNGKFLMGLGVCVLIVYLAIVQSEPKLISAPLLIGLALVIGGMMRIAQGGARVRRATAKPMLKRAAILHERRSEVVMRGSGGDTIYFYDTEFGDGVRGEFKYPGRGGAEEPWPNGATGVAYTRGDELIDFVRVRV